MCTPCNLNEQYVIGMTGGLLVGWIFGQFWQSFQDRNFIKTMSHHLRQQCSMIRAALKGLKIPMGSPGKDIPVPDWECDQLFGEALVGHLRAVEEIRDIGRKKGEEPILFPVNQGGGYATNSDLEEVSEETKKFRENLLSRADELEIMHTFKGLVGMGFFPALGVVEEQGYSLHPVYINNGPKNGAGAYSGTLLGVKITDPEYDPVENQLSKRAVIDEIVDVGGQDLHNRGVIHLTVGQDE